MKKYRVTKTHPFLIEGVILQPVEHNHDLYKILTTEFCTADVIHWETSKWIEEVQEPKWTDKDMSDFCQFVNKTSLGKDFESWESLLKRFKDSKNEKNS